MFAIGATLCADRGVDSNPLRKQFGEQGYKTCIPQRSNVKVKPINHVSYEYASNDRNGIERYFGWFKQYRAVRQRYDQPLAGYAMTIELANLHRCCSRVLRLKKGP